MKTINPPVIATWILEHLTPGDRNDALFGDLLEEFSSGRSASWYWRQVAAAIAIGYFREIRARSLVLVFATLWTALAPAWWFFALWFAAHSAGFILPWPDSTILGEFISVSLSLWAGFAAYLLLYALVGRTLVLERVVRGFWIGPLTFALLIILIKALSHPLGFATSLNRLTILTYFLSLVAAAWRVRTRVTSQSNAIAS